jgi:hypothetical protein
MKGILSFLFLAGTLAAAGPSQLAATPQSNTQARDNPQPQAANQASSHDRHHRRHSNSSGSTKHHHRHHKTSTKH